MLSRVALATVLPTVTALVEVSLASLPAALAPAGATVLSEPDAMSLVSVVLALAAVPVAAEPVAASVLSVAGAVVTVAVVV